MPVDARADHLRHLPLLITWPSLCRRADCVRSLLALRLLHLPDHLDLGTLISPLVPMHQTRTDPLWFLLLPLCHSSSLPRPTFPLPSTHRPRYARSITTSNELLSAPSSWLTLPSATSCRHFSSPPSLSCPFFSPSSFSYPRRPTLSLLLCSNSSLTTSSRFRCVSPALSVTCSPLFHYSPFLLLQLYFATVDAGTTTSTAAGDVLSSSPPPLTRQGKIVKSPSEPFRTPLFFHLIISEVSYPVRLVSRS